jgi:4-amino-4-deoxy-L-arabinose transferase-like glycosyltransferase
MTYRLKYSIGLFSIFLAALFIFTRNLAVHGLEYRDDEIFYYHSSQEMLQHHNYLSPTYFGENRFQKPILFYWLMIVFYKLFGINWFSARLASSIFGAMTVALTWLFAKKLFNTQTAHLSAIILTSIPLFFRHAKNAVPDMALNFFIVLALYCAYEFFCNSEQKKWAYAFFVSCALGFMVKGIAALVVPIVTVVLYGLMSQPKGTLKKFNFLVGSIIILSIVAPWFIYMVKVHGKEYWDYMLVKETEGRITGEGNSLIAIFKNLSKHSTFYFKVILNYFAPWSIFFFLGIIVGIRQIMKKAEDASALKLILIWIVVVYLIFSSMKFLINHYMMVLTTPFAMVTSYFLLHQVKSSAESFINTFTKWFLISTFVIGFAAFTFLVLFLVKSHEAWAYILAVSFVGILIVLIKTPSLFLRPAILGTFIIVLFTQSNLLFKAGIVSHATLQKFATTIVNDPKQYIVGVGSHDIHEKEFQVYFDQPVIKAATSLDHETRGLLTKLFDHKEEVYCLFIKKDFDVFRATANIQKPLEIVQSEFIVRKRMSLDKNFVKALFAFDRQAVEHYLKEEIILVKKAEDGS